MKRQVICYLLIFLFTKCNTTTRQDIPIQVNLKDTIESVSEFESIVSNEIVRLRVTDSLTIKDAIGLVKIYNSITSYQLTENKTFKMFYSNFNNSYMAKVVKVIQFEPSIGMGLYSKKYDLLLGSLRFPSNSYIFISEIRVQPPRS